MKLLVHCAASVGGRAELHSAVPSVEYYPERALLLADSADLVCVADEVDAEYLEYLAELGLGTAPANLVVASRYTDPAPGTPLWKLFLESEEALEALCHAMRAAGTSSLQPFIATQGHFDLAAALAGKLGRQVQVLGGDPELVAYADCRHHIRAAALELGVPVAPGEIVELHPADTTQHHRILRAAIIRQSTRTGRVIVRGSSGAGSGRFVTSARRPEIDQVIAKLIAHRDSRYYLVEAMVEGTALPSVQMQINDQDESVECGGVTDRRSDPDLVHWRHVHPSTAACLNDILRWSEMLARWLRDAGYAGVASFNFVEFSGCSGPPRAFFAELKPRMDGAAYPLAVLDRLGSASAFVSGTVSTRVESFADLRQALPELLYTPERGTGLLPYATGCLKYGRCGMISLAGSREAALELYRQAERSLGELCAVP